jgi:hypothetical protein
MELLFDDYYYEVVSDKKAFFAFFSQNRAVAFGKTNDFHAFAIYSETEINALAQLRSNMENVFELCLFIYQNDAIIGWSFGIQKDVDTFYMINTALFESYQNKGIYTALLPKIIKILTEKGFQQIYSRHKAANNQVIVPKLKQGFVITGFEISDTFGILVHLTYFTNPTRRKVYEYRTGQIIADHEIKHLLGMD